MKPGIIFLNLKEIYEQQINLHINNQDGITIKNLIDLNVHLFEKYQLAKTNPNICEDYLVFDYGVYERKQETGNSFIVNIVRHLSEYRSDYLIRYQLGTVLH